jgi:hypothetical protein
MNQALYAHMNNKRKMKKKKQKTIKRVMRKCFIHNAELFTLKE